MGRPAHLERSFSFATFSILWLDGSCCTSHGRDSRRDASCLMRMTEGSIPFVRNQKCPRISLRSQLRQEQATCRSFGLSRRGVEGERVVWKDRATFARTLIPTPAPVPVSSGHVPHLAPQPVARLDRHGHHLYRRYGRSEQLQPDRESRSRMSGPIPG